MKLDWRKIYILPRITTVITYLGPFQYKILINILFLNKKLFVFRKKNTPLCSFSNKEEETPLHIFSECLYDLLWATVSNFSWKPFDFFRLPCLGFRMAAQITMNPLGVCMCLFFCCFFYYSHLSIFLTETLD